MDSSNSHQPKPPGKRSRGAILKEARKAQGFSLDKIHEETKIPLDVLKAIEEGYTVRTLSPFYFKGFVKMYAQYLEVDPARVIDDYHKEEIPPVEKEPKKEERKFKEEPRIEFPSFDIQEILTPRRREFLVKGIAVLFVLFLITRIFGCVKNHAKNKAVKNKAVVEEVQKSVKKSKTTSQTVKQVKKVPSPRLMKDEETGELVPRTEGGVEAGSAAAPKKEEGVRLTVKIQRRGWLQVKTDGNVVFQSTLEEGAIETWKAKESIELSGKLIHSLDYKLNGKELGELGRDARGARRLVVTEKGMSPK